MLISVQEAVKSLQDLHPTNAPVLFAQELGGVHYIYNNVAEFVAHYKRVDTDFIYDNKSGLFLVGYAGQHVKLMAELYRYYGGIEADDYYAADQYVLQSHGIFKSKAGPRVYKSADFPLIPELAILRRDIQVVT